MEMCKFKSTSYTHLQIREDCQNRKMPHIHLMELPRAPGKGWADSQSMGEIKSCFQISSSLLGGGKEKAVEYT